MVDIATVIALISLVVATISAVLSYVAFSEERRLSSHVNSYAQMAANEALLEKHPELIALHNVDLGKLDELGVKPQELLYLMGSFSAAEIYYRLARDKKAELTEYRKNMVRNPKVRVVWETFIRDRFISDCPFARAVDEFLGTQPAATGAGVALRTARTAAAATGDDHLPPSLAREDQDMLA